MTAISLSSTDTDVKGRRGLDSRSRLLAAARKLFVERGYHATRPQDISREAGLGHGTFYLHFPDKQACFLAFVEEARAELDAHLRPYVAAAAGDLEGAIRANLKGIKEYSLAHPGVLDSAMMDASVIAAGEARSETLIDRWAVQWAGLVKSQLAGKGDLDDEDTAIIGAAIVGIIREGSAYARRHAKPSDRAIDLLTGMILRAVRHAP